MKQVQTTYTNHSDWHRCLEVSHLPDLVTTCISQSNGGYLTASITSAYKSQPSACPIIKLLFYLHASEPFLVSITSTPPPRQPSGRVLAPSTGGPGFNPQARKYGTSSCLVWQQHSMHYILCLCLFLVFFPKRMTALNDNILSFIFVHIHLMV